MPEQLCGCNKCLYCDIMGYSNVSKLHDLTDWASAGDRITKVTLNILELLLEKNIAYGDSATNPTRVFSKASPTEQLLVRIDDKLNRIMKGSEFPGDDTLNDLIGYLILLKVVTYE